MVKGLCRHLGGDRAATDLARILRLPGTWNHKYGTPREVRVIQMDEQMYSLESFADFAVEPTPDVPPVLIHLDEVPDDVPDRFKQLLKHNSRIRALWERDQSIKFPSGKESDSEYAFALMWECGANGFTDAECEVILRAFYDRPGMKPLHPEKVSRTLRAVEQGRDEASRWEPSGPGTLVVVADGTQPAPVIETQPIQSIAGENGNEQLPDEAPDDDLPPFPKKALVGLAGEFAATYAERMESPLQFFYIDYLTFQGAILSPHVRLDSLLREEPRIYAVKVGESWLSRKSTSQDEVERFFEPLVEDKDRLVLSYGAGSAEGLAKRMEANPGVPVLLVYDELRAFVNKSKVQGSVLLPMVTSLFSRTVYENLTKHSAIRVRDAHLSMVAACTIDTFTTMFTPTFRAIGALNRFLIIGGRRGKLRPIPQRIPDAVLESLRGRTKAQIDKAVRDKPVIGFTPEAERLWQEWYHNLSESPYSARLDTYGLRLLMLFAITTEAKQIQRPLVEAVIAFLDYEYKIRRELDPVDAENAIARLERLILRHLRKGRMSASRLRSLCHAERYGLWAFDQAIKNIQRQGWLAQKKVGRGLNYWLTKAGEEAASREA